jgi:hypothetical protein
MRGPVRSVLLAALAVCAFGALTIEQASAAVLQKTVAGVKTPFLAIYGNPGTNGASVPVGGGLGRNFGFGENMLFRACGGCSPAVGVNLAITLGTTTAEAHDSYVGGRLMSNQTGENNPLSFKIEFVDFQDSLLGSGLTPSYADTSDRPWITEICSPAAAESACKTDAQFTEPIKKGGVKIEDVSFDLKLPTGPEVVQGTVWGEFKNGTAGNPPCVKLALPAAGVPTLVVTQMSTGGPAVGTPIAAIKGTACLISANNDWYKISTLEKEEPEITLDNNA